MSDLANRLATAQETYNGQFVDGPSNDGLEFFAKVVPLLKPPTVSYLTNLSDEELLGLFDDRVENEHLLDLDQAWHAVEEQGGDQ